MREGAHVARQLAVAKHESYLGPRRLRPPLATRRPPSSAVRPRIPRSLRSRLLLLFAALAVGPLATVGILDYLRSERLVERLVIAQTDTVAHRAAKVISDRYALVASDVLLLSENAEVQRLIAELPRGDSASIRIARAAADEYLRSVWHLAENTYSSAELRDTVRERFSGARAGDASRDPADQELVITEPMRELRTGRVVGSVVLIPKPDVLWSRDALGPSFGRTGYGAIIDRRANRVLAHPRPPLLFKSPRELFGKEWPNDSARIADTSGWLTYRERDSLRTASFVSLTSPPWTILSSSTVGEFADGFLRARRSDIALLVLLIGAVAVAFVFFITRATRSLEELTRAAAGGRARRPFAAAAAGRSRRGGHAERRVRRHDGAHRLDDARGRSEPAARGARRVRGAAVTRSPQPAHVAQAGSPGSATAGARAALFRRRRRRRWTRACAR